MSGVKLLPNLGAEEGSDWQAFRSEARVRVAARLWSLLFSGDHELCVPGAAAVAEQPWPSQSCKTLWPTSLGSVPDRTVFDWLDTDGSNGNAIEATAWLNTRSLEKSVRRHFASGLAGPDPGCVTRVHDKAFATRAARELGLCSRELATAIQIIEPESLRAPDDLIQSLTAALAAWPDWMQRAFTLKPRFGSSGRGRVSGTDQLDSRSIRGAFPRLAERGGAIFEPWLSRKTDLSVSLFVSPTDAPGQQRPATTILGSLELLVTSAGVYRGHCGEVDSRGRIFSGHRDDETLRADAAAVANRARAAGFSGPCGVDAFTYVQPELGTDPEANAASGRETLRSLVEFNGRMTMGGVAIGLVRRALPQVRASLELEPGMRRGFLLTHLKAGASDDLDRLTTAAGCDTIVLELSSPGFEAEGRPILIFAREPTALREAHRAIFRC